MPMSRNVLAVIFAVSSHGKPKMAFLMTRYEMTIGVVG